MVAVSAGKADDAMVFAADASRVGAASGDSAIQLLAETAVAAVRALADPTRPNVEALVALAQQRAQSLSYRSLTSFTDEPDVTALAARLALPGPSAGTRRGLGGDGRRGPVRHLPEALGATRYEPEVAAADFLVAVDLSVTSASPQASQASWDSCSQHKVSPSASMIT